MTKRWTLASDRQLTPAGQIRDKHEVTPVGVLASRPPTPENKEYGLARQPTEDEGGWGEDSPEVKKEWRGREAWASVEQGEERG